MAIFKKLLFFFVIVGLIFVSVVFTAPLYLPPLLSKILSPQGIVVDKVGVDLPGLNAWSLPRVELHTVGGIQVHAKDVLLRYQLSELVTGYVREIDIGDLQVTTSETQEETAREPSQLPQLEQIQQALPFKRLGIAAGTLFQAIEIQRIELQNINNEASLVGELVVAGEPVVIDNRLFADKTFSAALQSEQGQFDLQGEVDQTKLSGEGSGQVNIELLKPWLPLEAADFEGEVLSSVEFQLSDNSRGIDLNIDAKLDSQLTSGLYFDRLVLRQGVNITGNSQTPTIKIQAGDNLILEQLRAPIELPKLTVALTEELIIEDFLNNLAIPNSSKLQLRTDKDAVDLSFQGKNIALNGMLDSLQPGMIIAANLIVESSNPLILNIDTGSKLSLGRIENLGLTSLGLAQSTSVAAVGDVIRFEQPLQLNLQSDSLKLSFLTTGQISPIDLSVEAKTDELVWQRENYGPMQAVFKISDYANGSQRLRLTTDATFFETKLTMDGALNLADLTGDIKGTISDLSQLNDYFASQCIEISRGAVSFNGQIDFNNSIVGRGQVALQGLSLTMQDKPIENIQFDGQWEYQAANNPNTFSLVGHLFAPAVGVGIALNDVNSDIRWLGNTVYIDTLTANTLGGTLYGRNQAWQLSQPHNRLHLNFEAIDLRRLVALEDYDNLEVSGLVNISMPLEINSGKVQVSGGKIDSIGSGGVIRFQTDTSTMTGQQKVAFDALKNFHFQTLGGGLSGPLALDPEGYLVSNIVVQGSNPDMGQTVKLNLNVEQNTYPIFQTLELFNKINRIGQCSPR